MYDWANSSYNLVITSTLFPIYFNGVTRSFFDSEVVLFFGFEIVNTVLYSYSVSVSFLIAACLSPLLSGIADYGGKKKLFLKVFTYLGSSSTVALFWFTGDNVEYGIIFSVLAGVGYSGSLVFYNSFLPDITSKANYDKLSARGYSFGYIGSVLLLLISFVLIEFHAVFGFESETVMVRLSFLMVGVWWFGFAQYSFYHLPNGERRGADQNLFAKGVKELKLVYQSLHGLKSMKRYLTSFFFYSMGVQTVMFLAATFGEKELRLETVKLIVTITLIQLVAIPGAYGFARLSKIYNNGVSILTMLVLWIVVCLYAYFLQTEYQFYGLAILVGLIMGGIQSMSRSTFSKLIPDNSIDNTSYFSFYDVTEKLAIVIGTFSFGFIEYVTGSMRNSTLALMIYFLIGIVFLLYSKIHKDK